MNTRAPTPAVPASLLGILRTLLALLALLVLSAALALMPLGIFSTVGSIVIAIVKAWLVMTFYMRLKVDSPLLRIVAGIGFAWLLMLIGMSVLELLTRSVWIVS
jgi:cytochrome c oxidase subunit IV